MSSSTSPSSRLEDRFVQAIAEEVGSTPQQVLAAESLLAEGATVPFIARYRKEVTSGLIDEQLEGIAKRRDYFLEFQQRRDAILASIEEQGKLTDELESSIRGATTKSELEDLYLPYKPRRRTRAQIARERGLEPLADHLLEADSTEPLPDLAASFVDEEKGVPGSDEALAGARDILAERLSESAEIRANLRETVQSEGRLRVRAIEGKEAEGGVYQDYFDHDEPARGIASHRLLAILRGEREGFLLTDVEVDDDHQIRSLSSSWGIDLSTERGQQVELASRDAYRRLLRPSIISEVRADLRQQAETESIRVFRANLEALLMQSPLGQVTVMGLDPGYRTGCKVAVVDPTGKVLQTGVIHVVPPRANAPEILLACVKEFGVNAIAIGNGTGSRETEMFARKVLAEAGVREVIVAIVPETGASVYSASALAREELPDLDVSVRGAVSIARRLQDPLAELVKIEPRSLGIGQYQHDVDARALESELDLAVEAVVNRVGVELNSASPALLRRVSGLSERLARNVVSHRDANGPFRTRRDLLGVTGFGPKTFELSAGFLRIRGGEHPLDATAVHPERYGFVERVAREESVDLASLVGDTTRASSLDFSRYVDESSGLGEYTLEDIRGELARPGRDPRPEFKTPELRDDVQSIDDVQEGMTLEGRVSNVTRFGAFVDLGIKRDGLVHLSELSHRWVEDPLEAVQVGEIVRVKVLEVDRERGRLALSIKALLPVPEGVRGGGGGGRQRSSSPRRSSSGSASRTPGGTRTRASSPSSSSKKTTPDEGTSLDDLLKQFAPKH